MTVFILGAGVMQIPAIRAAKDLGWTVAAADGNAEAPGACEADLFIPVDLKDRVGLVEAARGISERFGLDGVFTAGTDFSGSVAWVARELGLPGIPFDAAVRASDKLKMREALAAAGVPSPRYAAADSADPAAILAAGLGFPLVVKPADSMGARGCRAVRNSAELSAALAAALPYSRSGRAIVEEYVEGPEFSIDALVDDDTLVVRGVADRIISFAPYFVELGHTMPSAYPRGVLDEVLRVFRLGVHALGIVSGAAKGDIKYSSERGTAMVGEIAARLSGGYMSGWTYPYASGIDVTREALHLCVGHHLSGSTAVDRGWVSAERAFLSIPGIVDSVEGQDEAERLPYIKRVFLRVASGDRVVFPRNNVEKCGNVISQASSRDEAVLAAESAARAIRIRLRSGVSETEAFLAPPPADSEWPPAAFAVEGAAARELAAMPEYVDGGADVPPVAAFSFAENIRVLDWSGRGFAESAVRALELRHVCADSRGGRGRPERRRILAGRFWRALARGGLQAALYVLDTEDSAANVCAAGLPADAGAPR